MSTIAAISTPFGNGGIAVIRISGEEAFCVTDRVFTCQAAKRLFEVSANTVVFGKVHDSNGQIIDQALVTVFHAPHSYTGEDTVEISCHGGILVAKKVLKAVLEAGASLAERGEFSKRAFLNGKMDLSQAEGIVDLIHSVSDRGAKVAATQMEGRLSKNIQAMRERLLNLVSHLEAAADFPEEDILELTDTEVKNEIEKISTQMKQLIRTADYGKILKDGFPVAVIGKPNVGKSSLLNCLSGQERAIVTDVAGTTRDVIEEYINLDGFAIRLMDTAGIRRTADQVETIGVEKSKAAAVDASLVLCVFDASSPMDREDQVILNLIQDKNHIIVLNKCDQGKQIELEGIEISAKEGTGLDRLIQEISRKIQMGTAGQEEDVITNERHYECLLRSREALEHAYESIMANMPVDLVAIDLQQSIEALGEIVGLTVSEEIVDRIFHNFCLGK